MHVMHLQISLARHARGDSAQFALQAQSRRKFVDERRTKRQAAALVCARECIFFIFFPSSIRLESLCRRRIWLRRPRRAKLQTRTGEFFGGVVVSSSALPAAGSLWCKKRLPFRVWPHAWLLWIRYNSIKGLNLSRARSCQTFKYEEKTAASKMRLSAFSNFVAKSKRISKRTTHNFKWS